MPMSETTPSTGLTTGNDDLTIVCCDFAVGGGDGGSGDGGVWSSGAQVSPSIFLFQPVLHGAKGP